MLAHVANVGLIVCVQKVALMNAKNTGEVFNALVYMVYQYMLCAYQSYSLLPFTKGSLVYNFMLTLLGVKIEGRALVDNLSYEHSLLSICDITIIDSARVFGHYGVLRRSILALLMFQA